MSEITKEAALREIHRTLKLCNFCTTIIGLSFIEERSRLKANIWFFVTALILFLMVAGEINYVIMQLIKSTSIVDSVASMHIVGYGTMSFGKLLTIWYKRDEFRKLVKELACIWPVSTEDLEEMVVKQTRVSSLRIVQFWYAFWNILGVWLYNLTPIAVYFYNYMQGVPSKLGFIWYLSYPFDKTKPIFHEFAFIFEAFGGIVSVCCMLGSDMLFMTMASHISMLLRLLQLRIRRLGTSNDKNSKIYAKDCYEEIGLVIKTHQRLITYGNDLENAFNVVNLINVLLSSIDICCVVFNILLEPWMALSNKFFLGAALTQVGILCWYADEICTSSQGVADAVYKSPWYTYNTCCRRSLLIIMQRSQKPLHFTAFKFHPITMTTYTWILTNSYSYFTLLYTVYLSDKIS